MFDNICSLPLRSDIFAQAIHPTSPLFTVGLASGRVQTFRLPPVGESPLQPTSSSIHKNGSSLSPSILVDGRGRRLSENGFDVVETAWQTRRHKGSCRALAFSGNGAALYSAGTDGIVKVAETETGRVTAKILVPSFGSKSIPDAPSLIDGLSPQSLILGTDTGRLHVYDLRIDNSLPISTSPAQTLRPHVTESNAGNSEPLTSLTPLPPSASSTSGTSRAWITTSGSTLAVCDLRKGVVKVSEDQGDELLSSACVAGLGMSKKRRRMGGEGVGHGEKILVGGAGGVVTLWERGEWEDQSGRIVVHRSAAGVDDDGTVDALAVMPEGVGTVAGGFGGKMVVAGLGSGAITFVRLRGGGGDVVGEVRHDETGVESVSTLGFDIGGRMISGGGQVVKLWHEKRISEEEERGEEEEEQEEELQPHDTDSDDDSEIADTAPAAEGSDEEEEEEEPEQESDGDSDDAPRKRRKKKKGRGKQQGPGNGIKAFSGLD